VCDVSSDWIDDVDGVMGGDVDFMRVVDGCEC